MLSLRPTFPSVKNPKKNRAKPKDTPVSETIPVAWWAYEIALRAARSSGEAVEDVIHKAIQMYGIYTQTTSPVHVRLDAGIGPRIKQVLHSVGTREGSFDDLYRNYLNVGGPGAGAWKALWTHFAEGAPYVDFILSGPGSPVWRGSYWRLNKEGLALPYRPPLGSVVDAVLEAVRFGTMRRRAEEWINDLMPPVPLFGYSPEAVLFAASQRAGPLAIVFRYRLRHPPLYSIHYPGWEEKSKPVRIQKPTKVLMKRVLVDGCYTPFAGEPFRVDVSLVAAALLKGTGIDVKDFSTAQLEQLIRVAGTPHVVTPTELDEAVRDSLKARPLDFDPGPLDFE